MNLKKIIPTRRLVAGLVIGLIVLPVFASLAQIGKHSPQSDHRVRIAFGFHVNLYHSFRNDTNDKSGFGKDIRIIRHIIRTLDHFNQKGIPVKGIWDFDNLFSLQELLPKFAPDIIRDIQRRVRVNGDEVILMSYNNGLVSAMTPAELDKAVAWSISNPWRSGVKDLFGKYSPIVRPQEMMTTPGNFAVYQKHGIRAVALYYSATPFDAFRVFSRPLSRSEAHNPVRYYNRSTQEKMVVIPTYHFGDLTEHVSLGHWVHELHDLQNQGSLKQDALIFINFDADSELWEGIDLPWALAWLPNTGGLGALIKEVYNLPYVAFTTLTAYLDHHEPVGTISFSQDTADGSYDGYNSWAEKADASQYWTTIQRNRRVCYAAGKALMVLKDDLKRRQLEKLMALAEMKRLRSLATTNFGMATPFLTHQREQVMAHLMNDLNGYSDRMEQLMAEGLKKYVNHHLLFFKKRERCVPLDTVMILSPHRRDNGGGRFINIKPPKGYRQGMQLALVRSDGKAYSTINLGLKAVRANRSCLGLYIKNGHTLADGIYQVCAILPNEDASTERPTNRPQATLSNQSVSVHFKKGQIEGIFLNGIRQMDQGSLVPYLKWGHRIYRAEETISSPALLQNGQGITFRMTGPIPGPKNQTICSGWMDYRFTLLDDLPYLLLQGKIQYPTTVKDSIFKAAIPALMRPIDFNWQEAAPAEIRFSAHTTKADPVRVLKHNYLGIATEYTLDYFRHSDRNLNLDNINNHITDSYVGVVAGNRGMAIAVDTSVQANFAFAPLKLAYDQSKGRFAVSANPFGTYSGRQYTPFTRGNGNGFEATLAAGEQFNGAGPTYNGVEQNFNVMIAFFKGRKIPTKVGRDMTDYASPLMAISVSGISPESNDSQPTTPSDLVAANKKGAARCCQSCIKSFKKAAQCTGKIQFSSGQAKEKSPKIPLIMGAKIIWANFLVRLSSLFS
jgi:hypothetical protein